MKLALIVPGGVDRSGTHRVIPCLIWLLERISRHHDVHVFPMRGEDDQPPYSLRGATVHGARGKRHRTFPTLGKVLREHRKGGFALFHAFWISGPGLVAAMAGVLVRRPVLLHIPGGDLVAFPDINYGGRLRLRDRVRVRLALAAATGVTAPSAVICKEAEELGHRATRLPLGVSRDEWIPAAPTVRKPGTPARLIHVGSLNRVKDHATLLRAARRLTDTGLDFTLDLVGEDTLDGEIQRMAADLGLEQRIRFHGFVPQEELRPMVAGAHLMLVSSRHEAGPVAVAEAGMVGVPTVGTSVGILREWAPDAASVVPAGDDGALARAALELLEDDERRRSLAVSAQARTLAEDADWSGRQILSLYDQVTR